jgi:SAM-dependent methyltransferase
VDSPNIDIIFPESTKKYLELQCNSDLKNYTECLELQPILPLLRMLHPQAVLEIGAGLGRISVYINKLLQWNNTSFYLLDGDSGDKQVAGMHSSVQPHYYNSMEATQDFCKANGLTNSVLLNIEKKITFTNVKFDLCYSCKAIGFHWPIQQYLTMLTECLADDAYLFFELRSMRLESYSDPARYKRACRFTQEQLEWVQRSNSYKVVRFYKDATFPVVVIQKTGKK